MQKKVAYGVVSSLLIGAAVIVITEKSIAGCLVAAGIFFFLSSLDYMISKEKK